MFWCKKNRGKNINKNNSIFLARCVYIKQVFVHRPEKMQDEWWQNGDCVLVNTRERKIILYWFADPGFCSKGNAYMDICVNDRSMMGFNFTNTLLISEWTISCLRLWIQREKRSSSSSHSNSLPFSFVLKKR